MEEGEKKSVVCAVGSWIWGTIEGGFNEKQTVSQIIVDAVIGMIPLVGDVTAVRDLIAVIIRLVREPEKRKDKLEWVQLVLLVFALVPVAGGLIKGVGKIIFKEGSHAAELMPKVIEFLNRVGVGDAVKFIRELDVTKYESVVRGKFVELTDRIGVAIDTVLKRLSAVMPDAMIGMLRSIKAGINDLRALADRMIPDAIKELDARLKLIRSHLYQGEWHELATSTRTTTREAEARLVESSEGKHWVVEHPHFPPNSPDAFHPVGKWPNLKDRAVYRNGDQVIAAFSGPMTATYLKPREKIYRVIADGNGRAGKWWSRTLPENGRVWREDYAVLEDWSKNGHYVEFTVPDEGLWVWEGKAATQIDASAATAAAGQYLKGGGDQLFIDFEKCQANRYAAAEVKNLPMHATNWTDHMGVNVPESTVSVQRLGQHELEPKTYASPATAGGAARATRAQDQSEVSP